MVIKYVLSPYPTLAEDLVVKVYEAQSPDAEVYSQVVPAPHNVPVTVTINGMDRLVHIVRLFTAITNNKLHEYNVEPVADTLTVFDPIMFKVGDGGDLTPAINSKSFRDEADLLGLGDNDYTVFRNNYGFLFPNVHYTNIPAEGGFDLADPDKFNDEEEFLIQKKPILNTTTVNDSVVGKWVGGFVDVNADVSYNPTHLRKLIRLSGSPVYTFDSGTPMPIGYAHSFQNFGAFAGAGGVATIQFQNGSLLWGNTTKDSIQIPTYAEACFTWDGTHWNMIYFGQNASPGITSPQPGQIVGAGIFLIGDVPAGDPAYTVTHNYNIAGDYIVFLNVKSNDPGTYYRDNKIGMTWFHHTTNKPNAFNFSLQEISGEAQNISIVWQIIKM